MSELRMRPKSNYMHTASLQDLYSLTEHWKSSMEFYHDEQRFLKDLISKYLILITQEESLSQVQKIISDIDQMDVQRENIFKAIQKHLAHLEELMENPFSHDEQTFRNEHALLEEKITSLENEFHKLKRFIFSITEHVIKSEKLQHLLMA